MIGKEIIKKSSIVFIGSVISQSFGLIFMVMAARVLSKIDYGYFSYVISMGSFLATIVSGGFPISVTRFIAKDPINKRKYIENGFLGIILFFTGISIISIIIFWPYFEIVGVVLSLSLVMFYIGILRGEKRFKLYSIINSTRNIIKVILLLVIIFGGIVSKHSIVWVYVLGGLVVILSAEYIFKLRILIRPKYEPQIFRVILTFSIPLIFMTSFYSLANNVGVFILNFEVGKEAVASYKNAILLQLIYGFISGAIGVVLLPHIASARSYKRVLKILKDSILILIILEFLIFLGALLVGYQLIVWVFSEKYADVYPLFLVMSFGTFAYSIERAVFSSFWNGIGRPMITMISSIAAGGLVTLFTIFLVPVYGLLGAAYGYTIGFLIAVISVDFTFFVFYLLRGEFGRDYISI